MENREFLFTSEANLDHAAIVRRTVERIGFTDGSMGFDSRSCAVVNAVERQSPDIAMGIDAGAGMRSNVVMQEAANAGCS